MLIRPATRLDLTAHADLEAAAFGAEAYPSFFLRQAFDLWGDFLLIAERNPGEPAGYVLAAPSLRPEEAWLLSVAVRPEHRGLGIARRLLEELLARLAAQGRREVSLTVHPDNRAAVELYLKLGFRTAGGDPDYFGPGEPRVMMRLVLA